jgi:hypothetical protein
MADSRRGPRRKKRAVALDKRLAEEGITLTDEDDAILERVRVEMVKREAERLEQYAPIMTRLVEYLKTMDSEAQPLPGGVPVGLWWYARDHCREETAQRKNYKNEEHWSRRLRELLAKQNIQAETEVAYPSPPRRRCDLVIQSNNIY